VNTLEKQGQPPPDAAKTWLVAHNNGRYRLRGTTNANDFLAELKILNTDIETVADWAAQLPWSTIRSGSACWR